METSLVGAGSGAEQMWRNAGRPSAGATLVLPTVMVTHAISLSLSLSLSITNDLLIFMFSCVKVLRG